MKPLIYLQSLEKQIRGWLPKDSSAPSYQPNRSEPMERKHVSAFWYLLPLFLPIVGGVIAWAVIVDGDRKRARKLLVFGAIWTVAFVTIMIIGVYVGFVKVIVFYH